MTFWENVCKEMRRIAKDDPELDEALEWIDKKCKITKESFEDAVFKILYRDKSFKN